MIEIHKFKEDCFKGKCNRQTMKSNRCLKEYKQEQCFAKYNKQSAKKKEDQKVKAEEYRQNCANEIYPKKKIDENWEKVRDEVRLRDHNQCRLWQILTEEEKAYIKKFQSDVMYHNRILGVAHVVSRLQSKKLYYDSKNLYLLGWGFHFRLDNNMHPLTGEYISNLEISQWWVRIIGKEIYEWLITNK